MIFLVLVLILASWLLILNNWALPFASPAIALAKAGPALSAHTTQALTTWPVSAAIANAAGGNCVYFSFAFIQFVIASDSVAISEDGFKLCR
jgi:hypothetical protein